MRKEYHKHKNIKLWTAPALVSNMTPQFSNILILLQSFYIGSDWSDETLIILKMCLNEQLSSHNICTSFEYSKSEWQPNREFLRVELNYLNCWANVDPASNSQRSFQYKRNHKALKSTFSSSEWSRRCWMHLVLV